MIFTHCRSINYHLSISICVTIRTYLHYISCTKFTIYLHVYDINNIQCIYNDLLVSASEIGREASLSRMFRSEYQYIFVFAYCIYIACNVKKSQNLVRFNKYGRNKRHNRSISWCPLEHVRVLLTGPLLFLHSGYQNFIEFF